MAVFYAAASVSGAFSGLLAFAIEKMDGVSGLAGWKWMFILEDLHLWLSPSPCISCCLTSPETARFLTKEEREFIVNRIALHTCSGEGRVTNPDKMSWSYIRAGFVDWWIWVAVLPFWACSIGMHGFTATVPTVSKQMEYTSANAQLMTIPIYVVGKIAAVIVAVWTDHVQ